MVTIDLDGVLVSYALEDYKHHPYPYEIAQNHYFRNLEPINSMLAAALLLQKARFPFLFLSTIGLDNEQHLPANIFETRNKILKTIHYQDKLAWLQNHGIDTNFHPLICASRPNASKTKTMLSILGKPHLEPTDVLIDDFKENLNQWQNAGGTAVKFCNGLNSIPDDMLYLNCYTEPNVLASQIITLFEILRRT